MVRDPGKKIKPIKEISSMGILYGWQYPVLFASLLSKVIALHNEMGNARHHRSSFNPPENGTF